MPDFVKGASVLARPSAPCPYSIARPLSFQRDSPLNDPINTHDGHAWRVCGGCGAHARHNVTSFDSMPRHTLRHRTYLCAQTRIGSRSEPLEFRT